MVLFSIACFLAGCGLIALGIFLIRLRAQAQTGDDHHRGESSAVDLELSFPGWPKYNWRSGDEVADLEVRFDGEVVGSGDGQRGFRVPVTTTPGIHEVTISWTIVISSELARRFHPELVGNTNRRHSSFELALVQPGRCTVRLKVARNSLLSELGVHRIDPQSAGYVPPPEAVGPGIIAAGVGLLVISLGIVFRLLS